MEFKLAVKGIIRRGDGKVLIVKRGDHDDHKPGVWETVGGGVEEAGDLKLALKREITEEVGLEVNVREPFNVFTFAKDNGDFKVGITFICDHVSGEVHLSDEHTDFRWIKAGDFKEYDSVPSLYNEMTSYSNKFNGDHERFSVSQKAVLIREGRCFIVEVKHRPGHWDLPGGRIDNDESTDDAFRREIEEELGITDFRVLGTVDHDIWRSSTSGWPICGIVALIESDQEPKLSLEHAKGKWISENEIDGHHFVWRNMGRMVKYGFRLKRLLATHKY